MTAMISTAALRAYRNSRLYRPLARLLREYNARLVAGLHARGFTDFSVAFAPILSNLDTEGTRIGVIAARGGVSRQSAGQLLRDIERCGFVRLDAAPEDARATIVRFTPHGRRLLSAVFEVVEDVEGVFAAALPRGDFTRMRSSLQTLADAVDPTGAFGTADAARSAAPRRRAPLPRV
jgi:DNA-binding MarR family transcriptional regulator